MTRLILFFFGYIVYTLVSAINLAGHPVSYKVQTEGKVTGICTTDTRTANFYKLD